MGRDATILRELAAKPPTASARWADRLYGADPALNRAALSLRSTCMIGAGVAAEWLFVRLTMATPITGGLALMVWLARDHALSLVLLAAVTGGYTCPRRLGPRGLLAGSACCPAWSTSVPWTPGTRSCSPTRNPCLRNCSNVTPSTSVRPCCEAAPFPP